VKAFDKWRKIAASACFDVKVNDVLENTDLNEGDDIADLVIPIKRSQYLSSPEAIIEKLSKNNKNLKLLIGKFDVVVIY